MSVVFTAFAQERTVTGTVKDAAGDPLPGVAVILKGTTIGTVSNVDGYFKLSVDAENPVLTLKLIGFADQEISVGTQSNISVSMEEDLTELEVIVVSGVASGTPKKKLSVTVAKVGSDQIDQVPAISAAGALQGKVAGVTVTSGAGDPGSSSRIQLRGSTQISGSQDPLIIVDGVMIEGSLADINVNDIESYEVVKGASAASLYGSRAGNGVVVITTKRGTKGSGKTRVTLRNEFGMSSLPTKLKLNNSHNFNLASDWESEKRYTKYDGVTYPDGYEGGANKAIVGSRTPKDDMFMDNPYSRNFDAQDEIFKGGEFMTNYVAVSNNSDKTNFFASFENTAQSGIIKETEGYDRQNFRVNIDHRLNDKLTFSASNLYIRSKTFLPGGQNASNGGIFFETLLMDPDYNPELRNPDGQPYLLTIDPWTNNTNPMYPVWKEENERNRSRMLGSYKLDWSISDAFRLDGQYAFEKRDIKYTSYNPYDTWTIAGSDAVYSKGSLYQSNTSNFAETLQATLSFNKKFGDFTTKGKLSYLFENNQYEWSETSGNDFGVPGTPSFDAIEGQIAASSYVSQVKAHNYFAIVSLDYKDKYIFDGLFRVDGSSLFGENERWQNYYRISGAYRISEDVTIPGIDELKIRAAHGISGQRPNFSAQYENYSVNNGKASISTLGNKDLKPSRSVETEFGLNVDFLKRFRFELVYANTVTSDQFLEVPLPAFAEAPYQWQNAGTLESNTWEASLGINVLKKKNFTWDMNVIWDRTRQQITQLDVPAYLTGPEGQDANAFYIREGETFGMMYGRTFVKSLDQMSSQLPEGSTVDDFEVNSDGYVIAKGTEGTPDEAPILVRDEDGQPIQTQIGDSNPIFKMGLSSTFSYKGFSLYMLWNWKNGGDIYNRTQQWLTRDSRSAMMDQAGKADNMKKVESYYQGFYDANSINEFWVEDGSYVKLSELALTYNVEKAVLSNFVGGAFKGVKVSVIGRNLLTFTNYSGYDPEVTTNNVSGNQSFAFDFAGYPNFRTISGSLTLEF